MKITSTELECWGKTRSSQEQLPILIRKLITNSVDIEHVSTLDIPGGDSIWKPGVDGRVQVEKNFILGASGCYYIECGQSDNYKNKFLSDLKKRSKNLTNKTDITFAFITTQKIKNKEQLIIKEKTKNPKFNFWKEIKIFDADDIERFLDDDYATTAWLCDILGKPCDEIYGFDKKWNDWISSTQIPLDEQIILARENSYEEKLTEWLVNNNGLLEVRTTSKKESLMYLLASIQKITSLETKEKIKSKITIVENENKWTRIVESRFSKNLILIPMFGVPEGIATPNKNGYKIFLPLGKNDCFQTPNKINLENINSYLLDPLIEKLGGYKMRSQVHRAFSDGSLLLLQRILREPTIPFPKPLWASKELSEILLFLSVFNAWDDRNKKDIDLIEHVLNQSYDNIKRVLNDLINTEESPIQQIDNIFQVTCPELIIEYLGTYLTEEHINKLLNAIKQLLTTIDKNFSKEKDNGGLYSFLYVSNSDSYSGQIKLAAAQGLARLSNNTEYFNADLNIVSKINILINQIFENSSEQLWLFLNPYMPMLFEAAPQKMLNETGELFKDNANLLHTLVEYDSSESWGPCYYSGIIHGLENIAWLPEFLMKVTETLLKIKRYLPDQINKTAKPLDSLHNIYFAFCPSTCASLEERIGVLSALIETNKYNDVIIKLLTSLMPQNMTSIICFSEPRFIKINCTKTISKNAAEFHKYVFEQLFNMLEKTNEWHVLIDGYFELHFLQKEKVFNKLNSLSFEKINDETKLAICHSILSKVSWFDEFGENRTFSSKDIVLIKKLKTILTKITFSEKYKMYIPLFRMYNYKNENTIYIKALKDILKIDGISGILNLAVQTSGYEYNFINAFCRLSFSKKQMKEILKSFGNNDILDKILFLFIAQYFLNKEIFFINNYWNKNWSDTIKKNILLNLRESTELWSWIEENNLEHLYWSSKTFIGKHSIEEITFIANKLNKNDNNDALLEIVGFNKSIVDTDTIIDVLQKFSGKQYRPLASHYIQELMDVLHKSNAEHNKILQLEIKYLDILNYNGLPKALKKELSNPDSSLFVDIVKEAYWEDGTSNDEKRKSTTPNNDLKKVQELVVKLIVKIESCFIFDSLSDIEKWFFNNKKRLIDANRIQVGLPLIGEILGHCPKDLNDDIWPILEVRKIIEEEESESLERGLCIGKYNSIGIRNVTPNSQDMRNLYKEYSDFSKSLNIKFPRTSELLEKIANEYKDIAQRDINSYKHRLY